MNYATDYTVILTALYVLIIAIAFAPKTCKIEPVEKIEYFPEIETTDELAKKTHLVNLPDTTPSPNYSTKPSFIKFSENATASPIPQAIATEPAKDAQINPVTDLTRLTIRELKKLASGRIKNYSNLTKKELVLALS